MAVYSSMKQLTRFALILLLALHAPVEARQDPDIRALTIDGRSVILRGDHTWDFLEPKEGDPSSSAVLSVTEVHEMEDACRIEFRLLNNFGSRISTLVPRLAAFNKEGIIFESPSLSFTSIKPTKTQYTKIQITGIGCRDISKLKVADAAHCKMGNIDMFNEEEGQCLSHIYVEPSDLINITK